MESGSSGSDNQQVGANAGNHPSWVRRHLDGSIYLWACGEKADGDGDDPMASDRLIGWLILFVQGFAYLMLLVLSGIALESDTDSSSANWSDSFRNASNYDSVRQSESPYVLPAIAGAMYLIIASTSHDLRSCFSLLVDGECAGHRAFGIGLLVVYGIMLSAAMSVLVSTSHNSTSVVLNAVTVIFIADLDEKALKFISTVPRKWRLFWAIYSIGISFVLAILAVVHIGEDANRESPLSLDFTKFYVQEWPGWTFWVHNLLAVTILTYCFSACVQRVFEPSDAAFETADQQTRSCVAAIAFVRARGPVKRAIECVREDPCFFVAITVWVAQASVCWGFSSLWGDPVVVLTEIWYSEADEIYDLLVTSNKPLFVLVNACLAAGLALKVLAILLPRHPTVIASPELRRASVIYRARRERCVGCSDYSLSSLLVGWGIGYWVTSLLWVLGTAWEVSRWHDAPTSLSVVTFVVLTCFVIASIFMVADKTFLGAKAEPFITPVIERIQNTRGVVYWIMATVFRDVLTIWVYGWMSDYDLINFLP